MARRGSKSVQNAEEKTENSTVARAADRACYSDLKSVQNAEEKPEKSPWQERQTEHAGRRADAA